MSLRADNKRSSLIEIASAFANTGQLAPADKSHKELLAMTGVPFEIRDVRFTFNEGDETMKKRYIAPKVVGSSSVHPC